MKKIFLYLSLAIVLAIAAFLIYRAVYTANTGPSDEQLEEQKRVLDEEEVPAKFDALEASFDEDSTAKDTLN